MSQRNDTTTSFAARLLSHLIQSGRHEPILAESEPEADIVADELVRALLGPTKGVPVSPYSDKLIQRVCRIVMEHFTNPDFGAAEIAAEAGISLRYLQKLFTCRGTTCSRYIQSLRLSHAFTLLARRARGMGGQSIAEIAWASGYRDPSYFHRVFRQRFGHSPGACLRQSEATLREGPSQGTGIVAPHRPVESSVMTGDR